ncbi:MAG: sugar phosphate isomerase/epimerase [Propionicimonas sp.]|uniref:sugar phosphate isomerase/epimerase family protein n=1 Tax=Propionicimonas sp. TaxID=1955623 RepID=UPI002B20B0B8|nr:sugar phosphate isomerase/epimerase [Propionicimonas sp.]MEA4945577.1 sugar phosphate isomerase/epimerase [Propionicimonas sp.]MEA5054033.1 sugar phosphate isomerase/epimerase [Propionicimonas sp.]
MIQLANAPVSYGVFGLARPDLVPLPDGPQLAGWVAEAGYAGVDLGPVGLFGDPDTLPRLLAEHGLGLAGGWVDLPFGAGTDTEFDQAMAGLREVLPIFTAAAAAGLGPSPKPTLADSGSAERSARPGGGPDLELDAGRWARFVTRLELAAGAVREAGLEPSFHHHACTYVETPREIERFLADTDVDLTFDTGHLLLGGGEPLTDFQRWQDRINHLHLKDFDGAVLVAAAGSDNPLRDVWERRVFTALGSGDLDVTAIVEAILASGYDGWLVVEQDVILADAADVDRARADQVANRALLRRWFG